MKILGGSMCKTLFYCGIVLFSFSSHAEAKGNGWEILGINPKTKMIAYRNPYQTNNPESEVALCGYPGVEDGYGIEIGVWSIKENKTIQKWDVYKAVYDKEDCTPRSEAKKVWRKAERYFAKNNIDISKAPKGIQKTEENTYPIIGKDGKKYEFFLVAFEELPIPGEDGMGGYLLKRWIRNSMHEVVYAIEEEGVKAMASSLSIDYPVAYVVGDQVVFLEEKASASMRHSSHETKFTPAIDIK